MLRIRCPVVSGADEEMHAAFLAAKQAGKVDHWGVSTHQNAQAVLDAAADTGWYSLAQTSQRYFA